MFGFLARLGRDATGATAIEYGLILALLVIAILGAIGGLGGGVLGAWNSMANTVISAASARG
jgi:pilus assembly protein Flp/PilA